jgi:hypothetical protein
MPDYHARSAVLRELGYVDASVGGVVTLKGRVACEINTAVRELHSRRLTRYAGVSHLRCSQPQDELVATEMLFAGVLSPLSAYLFAMRDATTC